MEAATTSPASSAELGRNHEASGSTAVVLPFRLGRTAYVRYPETRGSTDEPDEPVVGEVFDYKIHGGKAFKIPRRNGSADKPKTEEPRRTFSAGTKEHTTLEQLRKFKSYGETTTKAARRIASRTTRRAKK